MCYTLAYTRKGSTFKRARSSTAISNRNYNVASSQLCFITFKMHLSSALRPLKTISCNTFTSFSPRSMYTHVIAVLRTPYIIVYLYVHCNSFDLLISFCWCCKSFASFSGRKKRRKIIIIRGEYTTQKAYWQKTPWRPQLKAALL